MVSKKSRWEWELFPPWSDESPVADFIADQPKKQQARIAHRLEMLAEFGPFGLGYDHVAKLRNTDPPVYELKIKGRVCSYRLFFVICGQRALTILHGIQKKGRRLPTTDRRTAEDRARKVLDHYEEKTQ
jgi:phage-related protein